MATDRACEKESHAFEELLTPSTEAPPHFLTRSVPVASIALEDFMNMDDLLCHEELEAVVVAGDESLHSSSLLSTGFDSYAAQHLSLDLEEIFDMLLQHEQRGESYGRDGKYLVKIQKHGMEASWRRKICRWMFEDEIDSLSQRKFSRATFRAFEDKLMTDLGWRFNPPTCFTFARDLIRLLDFPEKEQLETAVMDLLADVTLDYGSLRFKSSSVGISAVYFVWTTQFLGSSVEIVNTLHPFSLEAEELIRCHKWFCELHSMQYEKPTYLNSKNNSSRTDSPTSVEDTAAVVRRDHLPPLPSTPELTEPTRKKTRRSHDQTTSK